MIRKFGLALVLAGALLLAVPVVRADSLVVTFSPAAATVIAGTTTVVDVFGTITNPSTNTLTLFLNSDSLTVVPITASFTDFFASTPVSLAPGQNSGLIDLFQIVFDPSIPPGDYVSNYTLLGGLDGNAAGIVSNTAFFDVTVTIPVVTPEPGTLLLLGSGLGILVLRRRRVSA